MIETTSLRWATAEIDASAIEHNVRHLRHAVAPAGVWAVVKADGYGHGAAVAARAALRAGAEGLCVALVAEGVELRRAGIDAPILVFGAQPPEQLGDVLAANLTPTVFTADHVAALAELMDVAGRDGHVDGKPRPIGVHVNVDTGMQRVGVAPEALADLLGAIDAHGDRIVVAGIYSHLACADEPDHDANRAQIEAFELAIELARKAGVRPTDTHLANSAGALAHPSARRSFVRAGIAIYGLSPGPGVDHLCGDLRPAMRLTSRVSHVKPVRAGSHVSYGWRHRFPTDTVVATVPIGYADGVPRRLGTLPERPGGDVLIGGRRHRIVGVVTMDQLMVDVGDADVGVGDEVVLIGRQGDEQIRAEDWADRLGTISYEIVCGIGARVPRVVVGDSGDAKARHDGPGPDRPANS